MLLCAAAIVRNEADIIEAFVRHNLAVVDRLAVVDHGSFDGTTEILAALVREGLPLTVGRDERAGFFQPEVLTPLARELLRDPYWPLRAARTEGVGALAGEQLVQALGLLNAIVGAGKDAQARTYVALAASQGGNRPGGQPAVPGGDSRSANAGTGPDRPPDAGVRTAVIGKVGVITLDDRHKRNAISARMASSLVAALDSLRAQDMRTIVLRGAPGMNVWSAGHDIDELPRGGRDPLGYNDPLEGLLRAVRSFPMPVIAMVHGSVWGGALDLVLSCDLVIADETASFAITPANLGLPYNITGLLHFLGRLPVNLIKEMFFTAAPLDARKARECLIVNHLVVWDRLESFTMELAATMATKSPLAIAVIKEQLRVLSDYQPIAAQVYERVQGLRREAYDSSDYLEGLNAFTQKRPPIFRGT